jgi:signal recognition particle receptor subunit beta
MIAADTRGVVFVVDASAQEWSDTAEYLYGVLLRLQLLQDAPGNKREGFPVLVACNKSDLFTALPAGRIRSVLEGEVEKVREGRSKGIVGVGEEEEEVEILGGVGRFTFESLEELGVKVVFKGASTSKDGWRVPLGEWVGESL